MLPGDVHLPVEQPLSTVPQFLPQTAPAADTALADSLAVDTLTLGQRLRADTSWVGHVTSPAETVTAVGQYFTRLLLDPGLWIGFLGVTVRVVLILVIAAFFLRLVDRFATSYGKRFEHLPAIHPRRQRVNTVTNLLGSVSRYVVWPLVLIMLLGQIGVQIGALIATAGIAGVALGFGAQTLVRDVISGIFLLFDDTLHVGDLVRVGTDEGLVEHIGIRLIKVRRFNGELLMVPAGELRIFGNRSIGYARLIVNIGLSYEQRIAPVLAVMQQVADAWASDHRDVLLEEAPQVQAITDFTDSAVTARIVVQVIPGEQWALERDLRMRVKEAFDEAGIEIPFPRRTLYMRQEDTPRPYNPDASESNRDESES